MKQATIQVQIQKSITEAAELDHLSTQLTTPPEILELTT